MATSLGDLSALSLYLSASVVTFPSFSLRVTDRDPCWALTSSPSGSVVLPLEFLLSSRKTVMPSLAVHFIILLLGISLTTRSPPPLFIHVGPSTNPNPDASFCTLA